ncbi:hypothetical protein E2C01_022152 [Portunus trituberculatus]|uniref:Uncharacterized protein n=1 Tax=Portunus trituberculatus TaxID=210409 RepID=A0A5B7E6V1_PORTR|nr:hypothetical protein [Portunus trituberculatus]
MTGTDNINLLHPSSQSEKCILLTARRVLFLLRNTAPQHSPASLPSQKPPQYIFAHKAYRKIL